MRGKWKIKSLLFKLNPITFQIILEITIERYSFSKMFNHSGEI